MHDGMYVAVGYLATAALLSGYAVRLHVRARGSMARVTALGGRRPRVGR